MSAGIKANADGSAAIQVGGSDAITITSGLAVSMNGGAVYPITSGTAVASTSGTSIDFTGIPSTAKRVTMMFAGISSAGAGTNYIIQMGSGSIVVTGYISRSTYFQGAGLSGVNSAIGFSVGNYGVANLVSGSIVLTLLTGNTWVGNGYFADSGANATSTGGYIALSGALDRIRVTTNSTDTFDAGSINIMWE